MNWRHSTLYRKGRALALRVPRAARRWLATPADYTNSPPVLGNSFPKSGTHLLVQILEALPGQRRYETFIASTPSVPFRERSAAAIRRRIAALAPGELALAHLFHAPTAAGQLGAKRVMHYFVYRDLRDVVVSEAHYLTYMNRWHGMHRYFARVLTTDEARITASITGVSRAECGHAYPDIGQRWARYAAWLDEPDVCAVRFEELRAVDPGPAIDRVVGFYAARQSHAADWAAVARQARDNMAPARSHTFRRGEAGGWRTVLSAAQRDAFKAVAGHTLVELGYERDLTW